MPKLDLSSAIRIKSSYGEVSKLKGLNFYWAKPNINFDGTFSLSTVNNYIILSKAPVNINTVNNYLILSPI